MQSARCRSRRLDITITAVIVFASAKTAEHLVAGIPAAVRAAREVALAGSHLRCIFAVRGHWTPGAWCLAELDRLAPGLDWRTADSRDVIEQNPINGTIYLRGAALPPAGEIGTQQNHPAITRDPAQAAGWLHSENTDLRELDRIGHAIIAATGKPGDGIISRYLNRPVSHAISRLLLHLRGVTPLHATFGTMALGLAMAAALFLGDNTGLLWGALLFQAASIFDGVDGEIARATFRTSAMGAKLDSLTDMATNLAFIGGLTVNLGQQGHEFAATAGVAGFLMFAVGLFLIGMRSHAAGGSFTFDFIKHQARRENSPLMNWLTFLTMRDFIALFYVVLIFAGLASEALILFSLCAAIWLGFTLSVLFRTREEHRAP